MALRCSFIGQVRSFKVQELRIKRRYVELYNQTHNFKQYLVNHSKRVISAIGQGLLEILNNDENRAEQTYENLKQRFPGPIILIN
jgi:hypothetical protein